MKEKTANIEVDIIASAYHKESSNIYDKWASQGALRYIKSKEAGSQLMPLQLRGKENQPHLQNVLHREDIVNKYSYGNGMLYQSAQDSDAVGYHTVEKAEKRLKEGIEKLGGVKIEEGSIRMSVSSVKELYNLADDAKEEFANTLKELQKILRASDEHASFRRSLKSFDRVVEKALNDYGGDIGRILDVNGATLTLDTPESAEAAYEKALSVLGDSAVKHKAFVSDYGYKDFKINFKTSNGFIGELILIDQNTAWVKDNGIGHKIYNEGRKIEPYLKEADAVKYQNLFGIDVWESIKQLNNELAKWSARAYENAEAIRKGQYDNAGFNANLCAVSSVMTQLSNQLRSNFDTSYSVGLSSYTEPSMDFLSTDNSQVSSSLLNGVSQISKYLTDIDESSPLSKAQDGDAVNRPEAESQEHHAMQTRHIGDGMLYQLSEKKKSEFLKDYHDYIKSAVEQGHWVRGDYLKAFEGEDWADEELRLRAMLEEHPEYLQEARRAGSFEAYMNILSSAGEKAAGGSSLDEYRRIYGYATRKSPEELDRAFLNEHATTDEGILRLARKLQGFRRAVLAGRRRQGFYGAANSYGVMRGLSPKVMGLGGPAAQTRGSALGERIREARSLVMDDPRPYRMAIEMSDAGDDESRGLSDMATAAYLADADSRMERILSIHEDELNETGKAFRREDIPDWRSTAEEIRRKLDMAEADLAREGVAADAKAERLDERISELRSLESELERQMAEADEADRELADGLSHKLSEARRDIARLERVKSALARRMDAMKATAARKDMIRRILRRSLFNPDTYDASYEDSFNWVLSLFDKADRRELLDERSSLLSRIAEAKTAGQDASELEGRLEGIRSRIKASAMKRVPLQLSIYFKGSLQKADSRQSAWTLEELEDSLPHMRGGVSLLRQNCIDTLESSPHAWGCF